MKSAGVRSRCQFIESLEVRRLLSGPAAQLLAAMPDDDAFINYEFQDSAVLGQRLIFTGYRFGDIEQLWASNAPGAPTLLFNAANSTDGSPYLGITALKAFHDKLYFFANADAGDGLFVTDGTPGGTKLVKFLRPPGNVLPVQMFVLNDRLYFFWQDIDQPTRLWSTDGTTAGTVSLWDAPDDVLSVNSISPVIGNQVFFGASGRLWRTDGTAAGTSSTWAGLGESSIPPFLPPRLKSCFLSAADLKAEISIQPIWTEATPAKSAFR